VTLSDLLEVVYHFYPRGLIEGADDYWTSEEVYRQGEAARRGVAAYPTWKAMLRRLGDRYPLMNHSLSMEGPSYLKGGAYDQGYWGHVEIPGHMLGFHVSFFGPYYGIHRTGALGEGQAALDLAREIEATYPGYEPIPPELGNEVVPDVVSLGKTTIYECLLSEFWARSSEPLRPWVNPPPDHADGPPAEVEGQGAGAGVVERETPVMTRWLPWPGRKK
jgi:hypothetical protein